MNKQENGTPEPKKEEDKTSENVDKENKTPKNEDESKKVKEYKERMKHHQKKQKELEEEVANLKSKLPDNMDKSNVVENNKEDDVDHIIDIQEAIDGLDRREISHLKTLSKAKGKSLTETREDEDFKLWQKARQEQVEKETQTPEPDTRQAPSKKGFKDWTREDMERASDDERLEFLNWR